MKNSYSKKFFYGLDEVSCELNSHVDKGLKSDYIAHFAKCLNAKTMRVWLRTNEIVKVNKNDQIELIPEGLIRLHAYLHKLKLAGVERFLLLDWSFVYPSGYNATDNWVVPSFKDEPEMYQRFMLLQEKVRYEIARNFTEIGYFETTNEPDGPGGTFLHKNGYGTSKNGNDAYTYNDDELQTIILDLNYYVSRGVKRSNPKNKMLLPSLTNFPKTKKFLDDIYNKIESNQYPTFGKKSNRIEDFFDILNIHPYNMKHTDLDEEWVEGQLDLYNVAIKHNDAFRPVWYTEMGWSDLKRETEKVEIGKRFVKFFEYVRDRLNFVETVFPFRLFTLANRVENEGEDNFGLLYNEYDWRYPLYPKECLVSIYKFIQGEDADTSILYKYAKVNERKIFDPVYLGSKKPTFKILFLGNKITYQSKNSLLGWNESRGLGSSDKQPDYVSLVIKELSKEHNNIGYCVTNIEYWETDFHNDNLLDMLSKLKDYNADLVIIQTGDSALSFLLNDYSYSESYEKLINTFKNDHSRVISISPLKSDNRTYEHILKACQNTNTEFVDITKIFKNPENICLVNYHNGDFPLFPNGNGHALIANEVILKLKS